ncbi:hypothetical protein POM88_026505 [Heracleum sosnowskyi]|uniref:AAA+ ATPase At3g28540-like C-terminal domain-containing protein n=1 Tax=Heracleum sosnowskyi TaxID=360622 RepID=A0AAD8I645_9APIA|nr:hypothetical protein POM88_026505 [Heracleum sosnowskyi]
MIAAMANLLNYDIYDLELTAVRNNTELRMLLTETTSKSIIVIEDIDCSLDLSGQRIKKEEKYPYTDMIMNVLAKNYLEVEAHPTFDLIQQLIEEINITPADVAEKLMPKMAAKDADVCLSNLIRALDEVKDDQKRKEVAKA